MKMNPPFDLVIGLDRSDRKADLHWIDLPTGAEQRQTVPTTPEALQAWADALRRNHPDSRVAVCFEEPANNLIAFLVRYDWLTLYPITHPDREIFRNLPGAGRVFAPRLLTSVGTRREEHPRAFNLQCASGIALVTKQSRQSRQVQRRCRGSVFLKQSLHEWAAESRLWSDWAGAFSTMKRAAGMRHHAAVRALAYKWIRAIWRCQHDRLVYDETRYLVALKKHGSPIIAWMEKTTTEATAA